MAITFAFRADTDDSGASSDQSDEDIVDSRGGAGQQFAVSFGYRRDKKVQRGGQYREQGGNDKVAHRSFYQVEVRHSDSQSDTDNRPHKGGNKHGADDDGGGIRVQAERRYQYGQHQDYEIRTPEADSLADGGFGVFLRYEIGSQDKIVFGEAPESVPERIVVHKG